MPVPTRPSAVRISTTGTVQWDIAAVESAIGLASGTARAYVSMDTITAPSSPRTMSPVSGERTPRALPSEVSIVILVSFDNAVPGAALASNTWTPIRSRWRRPVNGDLRIEGIRIPDGRPGPLRPVTKIETDRCPTDGVFTMALDLTWLRTWVEVVDAGGFARAAELVHLSQPRVSAHISNLEKELGCTLIERRVRPLTLTEEGKALLPRARAVLAAADELTSGVLAERGIVSGTVKVASFASASSEFLPSVVTRLEQEHPQIDLSILDGDVASIEAALTERRVAVALRPLRPEPRDRAFSVRPLWREPFVVVVPAGHPLLDDDIVDPRQLTRERVITIGNPLSDEGLGSEAESALSSFYRQLPGGTVSYQPSTLGAMVRAGHGIGVMNYLGFAMIRQDGLEIRELGIDHYRDVGVWWHSERPLTAAAQAFITTVIAAERPEGTWEIPVPR